MVKKYYSKISYGLLIFIFIVFFGPLIPVFMNESFHVGSLGLLVFLLVLFAFILHMFFKTIYTINQETLSIKCGFISFKPIKISSIKEIHKTRNIISSPAASLDRIEIKHGEFDSIIISPKNKLQFSKDLLQINPNIKSTITRN